MRSLVSGSRKRRILVPETGIEPVRPLACKRRIFRVMRTSEKLAIAMLIRLMNFNDQHFDQRL
jgi:hypothetical protein